MRTLALLGGMTPDVTVVYYNIINNHIRQKLGHRHSAKLHIFSVDLEEQLSRAAAGNWKAFADEFRNAIGPLVKPTTASPDFKPKVDGVLFSAILAHKVAPQIEAELPSTVPFLHVADFVAAAIKEKEISTVGLIGPGITMTTNDPHFFIGKLQLDHSIKVLVPDTEAELDEINRGMFEEVAKGKDVTTPKTRQMFKDAANKLIERGAKGIILGSTDLGFVLEQKDFDVPVFDAAKVHALGAAEWALQSEI
jgi:aspartate racemase